MGQLLRCVYSRAGRTGYGYPAKALVVGPAVRHHWRARRVLDRAVLTIHSGPDVFRACVELPGGVYRLPTADLPLGTGLGGCAAGRLLRLPARALRRG